MRARRPLRDAVLSSLPAPPRFAACVRDGLAEAAGSTVAGGSLPARAALAPPRRRGGGRGDARRRRGAWISCTTAGAETALPAITATAPAFASVALRPAVVPPAASSAMREESGSTRSAAASQYTRGMGATAVAAARSVVRARWTS